MLPQLDFAMMFLLGLAGSLHCVQMCGPIVLSLDMTGASGLRSHLAYHSGRLVTYAFLGALGGWVGARVSSLVALGGFRNGAAIGAGILMIIAGLILSGAVKPAGLVQIGPSSTIARLGGRLLRSRTRFLTGLVLGFLPCGLLYGALLKSFAASSILGGAVSMFAFGLGTAGPLLGLGAFSSVLGKRFRSQKLAAIGIALMGVMLVWRGWPVTQACPLHPH